jgi:hypothetical protein
VQVNNSYKGDKCKTASLYEVKDNGDVAQDKVWFTEHIIVKGDHITTMVGDDVIEEWMQPSDWTGTKSFPGRRIAPGTIALQGMIRGVPCTRRTSGSSRWTRRAQVTSLGPCCYADRPGRRDHQDP